MDVNRTSFIGGTIGTAISAMGIDIANLQSIQSIVAIVCTALGAIITLITSVVIPLIKWWKKSKEDGKITVEELDELKKELDDIKKDIDNEN